MAIFVSRSRSRSPCPLVDIMADNIYYQSAHFKPSRQGRKKRILLVLLFSVLVLSVLQICAKRELIRLAVEKIQWPIIQCGR